MNDYKYFIKYFEKPNKIILISSGVLAAIGVLFAWLFFPPVGLGMIAIAACIVIFYFAARAKDSDFDDRVKNQYELFKNEKLYDLHEHINKNPLKIKVYDFGCPVYEGENILIKRGGDGVIRTSRYCSTLLLCDEVVDKITVFRLATSFVDSNESNDTIVCKYHDINNISMIDYDFEKTVEGKTYKLKYYKFTIKLENGDIIDFPAPEDAATDEIIVYLNRRIAKLKSM